VKIQALVEENMNFFKVSVLDFVGEVTFTCICSQADPESEIWKDYVNYLDEAVVDGFYSTVLCSLNYLFYNTDKTSDIQPLLECKLELQAPEMVLIPSLDQVPPYLPPFFLPFLPLNSLRSHLPPPPLLLFLPFLESLLPGPSLNPLHLHLPVPPFLFFGRSLFPPLPPLSLSSPSPPLSPFLLD
jgi:hypothetical protein